MKTAGTDRLARIRHVALDMDGTLYRGSTLFPFTPAFLDRLTALGIGRTFLTNNSSRSREDYVKKLRGMGIAAESEQVYTSAHATIDYLKRERPELRRLHLIATASVRTEFAGAGFNVVDGDTEPDAVVVGFDLGMTYEMLCRAAWWISKGKAFLATHPDRVCPTDQPTILVDCGAICAALESATGRAPEAVPGKPDPRMLTGILARHGLRPDELAMVGDRLYTDVAMAHRAGALGVLVLTGEATAAEAAKCPEPPDLVVPSVRELGEMLAEAGRKA